MPLLRRIGPFRQGLLEGLLVIPFCGSILGWLLAFYDVQPRENLLISGAEIGATLLVAYVVVAAFIVKSARREPGIDRQFRLGALSMVVAQPMATEEWAPSAPIDE